jgi:cytochrome c oxidase cbb3-type subunit II
MDRGMILFLGCALTFTSSWLGLVFAPLVKLNNEQPHVVEETTNTVYPMPMEGIVAEGHAVYKENGCIYCHSQYIRDESFGNNADIKRGWGKRRTVPRDYMYDKPIQLGTMRTGPDLSNIAIRYSDDWHHKHLWKPDWQSPGSIMPRFAFLYETRKIVGERSVEAINFGSQEAAFVQPGYEVVPTAKAKALVAFLMWMERASVPLPEVQD